ncbi:unnamed protein product [Closterium sp. Naga37s-1]|nr:unnamed protein product [Closterium sp. Naga37s-1]
MGEERGTRVKGGWLYKQRLAGCGVGGRLVSCAGTKTKEVSGVGGRGGEEERKRVRGEVYVGVGGRLDDPTAVRLSAGHKLSSFPPFPSLSPSPFPLLHRDVLAAVVVCRLDQSDAFLVLGSDGLWEHVGDDEAIGVVVVAWSIERAAAADGETDGVQLRAAGLEGDSEAVAVATTTTTAAVEGRHEERGKGGNSREGEVPAGCAAHTLLVLWGTSLAAAVGALVLVDVAAAAPTHTAGTKASS